MLGDAYTFMNCRIRDKRGDGRMKWQENESAKKIF